MLTGRSISVRLMVSAAVWVTLTLLVTAFVLIGLVRDYAERSFDDSLYGHVDELLALSHVVDGKIGLKRHPVDPEYVKPLSGWYWQVVVDGAIVERSRSLWDQVLGDMPTPRVGERVSFNMTGPRGEHLRVAAEAFTLPGADSPLAIFITGRADRIDETVEDFSGALIVSLLLLGVGVVLTLFVQVRFGLKPLKHLQKQLAAIHAGEAARMEGQYADEVQPLVDSMNDLLEHNADVVERSRTQAGNLAHALKTPLAVLANEGSAIKGESGETIALQIHLMNDLISRHLTRARTAGARGAAGSYHDALPLIQGLVRTLQRIYERRHVRIDLDLPPALRFQGEPQDLEEMLGNLMDNACKWAREKVLVVAVLRGKEIVIRIDDDGPGIPEEHLADVLTRGRRLDESTPGSGLGLDIVRDMAELYGGSLVLERSPLNGLRASLTLPGG